MITFSDLEKTDKEKMYQVYDKWPEIAEKSYHSKMEQIKFDNCNHVIFAGMGGSGSIADVFASILSKKDIHVDVVKGYDIPKTVNSNSIIIAISVSGNTKEVLSILKESLNTRARVFAFSSGGLMEEFCLKNKIRYFKIPMYHSPRASFVSFLFSMLKVLENVLSVESGDIEESIKLLKEFRDRINSTQINEENPSIKIAEWIKNTPLIYYPWGLESAAIRFKNSLQENAKIHVFTENIIEACHNNIVAWDKQKKFQAILIEGQDDHPKTKERWQVLKEYFDNEKIDYFEIMSEKGSILSKISCLIYLLDYASIYLAAKLGIDPSPIAPIDYVKSRIS